MRKNQNRLATLALSMMLVVGMAMPAFAAMAPDPDFGFDKVIDMSAAEKADVPNVSYKYEIKPGAGGERDAEGGKKVQVFPGVDQGVGIGGNSGASNTTVSFTAASLIDGNNQSKQKVAFYVDAPKFGKAGVYEYTVTETRLTDIDGLKETAEAPVTLYVTILNTDGGGLKYGGAVFSNGTAKTGEADFKADYTTHSLTIKKAVTGDLGDKSMMFDFADAITAANGNEETYYIADGSGKVKAADKFQLKDGDAYTIYGLSEKDSAAITETVDAALGYTTTAEAVGATREFDAVATGGGKATVTSFKENATLTVTNNRENITPTGVVMDAAPYVLMLGAAGGLGAGFVFRKREDEE